MRSLLPVLVLLSGCWLSDPEIGRKYLDPRTTDDTGTPKTDLTDTDTDTDADTDTDTDSDTDTDTDPFACADDDLGSSVGDNVASDTTAVAGDDHGPLCEAGVGGQDLAWSWTAPSAGCWQLDTDSAVFDTVLAVFDDCGGAELVCNDDVDLIGGGVTSQLGVFLDAGQQILVVADGWDANESGLVTLDITATTQIVPDVVLGSVTGSPADSGSSAAADSTTDPALCSYASGADVFVAWTAPSTGVWLFDTNGSDYDTVLSVERPCTEGPIVCADVFGNGGEVVDVWLISGEAVLVRIGGWDLQTGTWQLGINLSP